MARQIGVSSIQSLLQGAAFVLATILFPQSFAEPLATSI
jgi:hypothetical protein